MGKADMSDEKIDKELSRIDIELFNVGHALGIIFKALEPIDHSCAWEVRQTISALTQARVRIKQSIEKPILPTSKEIRAIFKKGQ